MLSLTIDDIQRKSSNLRMCLVPDDPEAKWHNDLVRDIIRVNDRLIEEIYRECDFVTTMATMMEARRKMDDLEACGRNPFFKRGDVI